MSYVVTTLDQIIVSEDVEQIDFSVPAGENGEGAAEFLADALKRCLDAITGEPDQYKRLELFDAFKDGLSAYREVLDGTH